MLHALDEGLWIAPSGHRVLGIHAHRQLVVVRLPGEKLWIHSPDHVSPELRDAFAGLGRVTHVMAPSLWHDECLETFQAAYPEALLHGTMGMAGSHPKLRISRALSDVPHPDWAGELDQHLVRGMPRMNEVVFLHRRSRTLILADLAMNVGPPGSFSDWVVFSLAGAWGRFTPTRFCRRLMTDRKAVRASIEHILRWDFDRILVGHGRPIETSGKAALREAFAFLGVR